MNISMAAVINCLQTEQELVQLIGRLEKPLAEQSGI